MYSFSSYRIGSRATETNSYASSSESSVLRSLFELRKSDTKEQQLSHLTFWNCSWSPRVLKSLSKILVRDGRRFASIKFFDCAVQNNNNNSNNNNNNKNTESFAEILAMIMANNSTTSLVIRGGTLIGDYYGHLEQPQQQSCESTSSEASPTACSSTILSSALTEGLSTNTSLINLKMSGFLDDQSLAQLLRSIGEHPSLVTLNLSKNYLGARNSNSNSKSPSTKALDAVAELLRSTTSKLESLDLSQQYQQHPNSTAITTEALAKHVEEHRAAFGRALCALSVNTGLRKINLSNNPACFEASDAVKALSNCLASNSHLEYADVSGCGMTREGIAQLANECLPVCGESLKALVLFGTRAVTTSIPMSSGCPSTTPEQPPFTTSYCDSDDCGRDSASALEKGLSSNTTIETLGDLPSSKAYGRIQQTLNQNKGGRRAFVNNASTPLAIAAWSHVLARAGHLNYHDETNDNNESPSATASSVVFALLRQGPILMER